MHDHSHCDHHRPASYGRAFAIGIGLNTAYILAEVVIGLSTRSLSLVADAGHNLGDVFGLAMGWIAAVISARPPKGRRTYGYRRSTILAALANAVLLLVAVGAVAWEAIQRFSEPISVPGKTVMIVAAVGIFVNGGTALMFLRGRKGDLNIAGAYAHMAADALVSLGVVVAGAVMMATRLAWIDSAVSLVISLLVGLGSWGMLRKSLDLALDAVPEDLDLEAIRRYLAALPGVTEVTDLHVWSMSTTEVALTAHLVAPNGLPEDHLSDAQETLGHDFRIAHATIQVDRKPAGPCPLAV